jgi:hypothetical protein
MSQVPPEEVRSTIRRACDLWGARNMANRMGSYEGSTLETFDSVDYVAVRNTFGLLAVYRYGDGDLHFVEPDRWPAALQGEERG